MKHTYTHALMTMVLHSSFLRVSIISNTHLFVYIRNTQGSRRVISLIDRSVCVKY